MMYSKMVATKYEQFDILSDETLWPRKTSIKQKNI